MKKVMDLGIARHFRDEFRQAREVAYGNAENFQDLLFSLERLGIYLTKSISALGPYKNDICQLAKESPLAEEIPESHREWHMPFSELYDVVKDARNDALHQGAFARHLTSHATQLALVLEDALMETTSANEVGDYMVRNPVCASLWQPISFIRQQMLENSYSYLPFLNSSKEWKSVSDYSIARYLRSATSKTERKKRLAKSLKKAISDDLETYETEPCFADETIETVLGSFDGKPFLVIQKEKEDELLGILTAFDLL